MTTMGADRTAAWRGAAIASDDDWFVEFDELGLDGTLDRVISLAAAIDRGELDLVDVDRRAVDDPSLITAGRWLTERLFERGGFALVRGLPVEAVSETAGHLLFWLLGSTIGAPLHQNAGGDLLVRVRDEGKSFDEPGVRAYETTADLAYHTDSADVVGLLCRRPAETGGVSTIVSSAAVIDEIERRRPDLAPLVFERWLELNPVDGSLTEMPISARAESGWLATRYGRKYTELAAERAGHPLTAEQTAVLDLFDEITNDPAFVLDMQFRPGDVQFLNNHRVLHARTAYQDGPDPATRRELWRLWLVNTDLDVPDVFADAGFIARTAVIRP